jgi:hypothetical protein
MPSKFFPDFKDPSECPAAKKVIPGGLLLSQNPNGFMLVWFYVGDFHEPI